jgi:hypothetical protein
MRKFLLVLLAVGALLTTGCVVGPWHATWDVPFFIFPFWLFGMALYFLPTIIVLARRKKNVLGPILVNVLLGWTFIGWIVALIWACLVKE